MLQRISEIVAHYGYAGIFGWMLIGVFLIPLPVEAALVGIGALAASHKLAMIPAEFAAAAGACAGVTLSYALGLTAGLKLVIRFGYLVGLTRERLDRFEAWYARKGRWSLTLGFFVPGVRHITGLAAGASKLPWPTFMLHGYAGGVLWTGVFTGLGYAFASSFRAVKKGAHVLDLSLGIAVALACLGAWAYQRSKKRRSARLGLRVDGTSPDGVEAGLS